MQGVFNCELSVELSQGMSDYTAKACACQLRPLSMKLPHQRFVTKQSIHQKHEDKDLLFSDS